MKNAALAAPETLAALFCEMPRCRMLAVIKADRLCFRLPMKLLWLKVIPLLTCLVLATACTSSVKLGNVLVTVTGYHATTDATKANVALRFTNENVFALAIAETSGKLYLNNTYIGQLKFAKPLGLPPQGVVNRDVELVIENAAYVQQLRGNTGTSSVSYRLESILQLEVSEEHEKIKTVSSGLIEQPSFQAETVKAP